MAEKRKSLGVIVHFKTGYWEKFPGIGWVSSRGGGMVAIGTGPDETRDAVAYFNLEEVSSIRDYYKIA